MSWKIKSGFVQALIELGAKPTPIFYDDDWADGFDFSDCTLEQLAAILGYFEQSTEYEPVMLHVLADDILLLAMRLSTPDTINMLAVIADLYEQCDETIGFMHS